MDDVSTLFDRYPADCRPTQIEPLGNNGGMSGAKFWRITASRGRLILRRWPIEHPTPERLSFIHAVLTHAVQRGIEFIPVPISALHGRTFVEHAGYLWELAPWMPGAADYAHSPSVEKLRAAMKTLARFHVAVGDFPNPSTPGSAKGSPAITDRIARLQELAHGGCQQLAHAMSDKVWPEIAPLARQFLAALPNALPQAIALHEPLASLRFALKPCMRDIWHDHVLFTGERVTGIVDFGAMDIDTPACDVARLLGGLVGNDVANRQIGLKAYDSVRQLSANELQAVAAFDSSIVLLAGCNWIRWIYIESRQFENPAQIVQYFRRIVERTHMIVLAQRSG